MASRLSGQFAGRERGAWQDSRHPVMTEDMIRQLPTRRDGTGYALVLSNGLSPVIGRPPVIWRDRPCKRLARLARQSGHHVGLSWPGGDGLGLVRQDGLAGLAPTVPADAVPVPEPPPGACDLPAVGQREPGPSARRGQRAWDQIGTGQ